MLEILCTARDKNADRLRVCQHLADHLVAALAKLDRSRPKRRLPDDDSWDDESLDDDWSGDSWQMRQIDRAALLGALVKSLVAVGAEKPLAWLIDHSLAQSRTYDLTDVHLKAIFAIEARMVRKLKKPSRAISRWLEYCRIEL